LAILIALEWLTKLTHTTVSVFSDSKSAIFALQERSSTVNLVNQIHAMLEQLQTKDISVNLSWIRAHVGTPGNLRADELAKLAAKNHNKFAYDLYPKSYARKKIFEVNLVNWWRKRFG
jgi:ribonuclease HI